MLYDDGFALPDDGNKSTADTDSSVHGTADTGAVERLHDPRLAALPSDIVGESSSAHEVLQHSHRTHHQTQQAVSSP